MPAIEAWLAFYFQLLGQVLISLLLFHGLEKLKPVESKQPLKALIFNLTFLSVNLGLVLWLLPQIQPIIVSIKTSLHGGLIALPPVNSMSLWQAIAWSISYAIIWDLLQYVTHRLQHSVPFLWNIHEFHHKEKSLSTTSTGRKHILEYAIEDFTIALPTLLLFSDPTLPLVTQIIMFRCWGFFIHMNLKLNLGPLGQVITGPQFHRIHHSILPEHFDKNFATFFPFIDRIFGTYHHPSTYEYPPTGISGEEDVQNIIEVNILPIRKWLNSINKVICSASKAKAAN